MELAEPYSQIMIGLTTLVLLLALVSWAQIAARLTKGEPLISFTPRRSVPWGVTAVLLFVVTLMGAMLVTQGLASVATAKWDLEPAGERLVAMGAFSASSLLAMALTCWAVAQTGAGSDDWGSLPTGQDVVLAIFAFGAMAPVVYAIQAVLSRVWKSSEHPIIELVGENPSTLFFVALTVSAVVVAPLAEEFFFRVLLQGWLESLAAFQGDDPAERQRVWWGRAVWPGEATVASPPEGSKDDESPADVAMEAAAESAPAIRSWSAHPAGGDQPETLSAPAAAWPVWVSSLLFALAHAGYGPDPFPLFLLALSLGYLYRRTHRIWPCIFLHMLVNGTSMIMLWAMVRGGAEF